MSARLVALGLASALLLGCSAVLPPTPAASAPASPGASSAPGAAPAGAVSFQAQVVPVLRQHCAQCHVTGGIGPFAMFDASGTPQYATIQAQLPRMIDAIRSGVMPRGKPKGTVSDAQLQTLVDWQAAGAPNN